MRIFGNVEWAMVLIIIALVGVKTGQTISAQAPTDDQKVQALEAQVRTLQARLQQQQGPVAEQFYANAFRTAKTEAQQACKEAGGKLWVMVSRTAGQPLTSSVSCEMK